MSFPCGEIEEKIGYVFRDKELLKTAFTHSSYVNGRGGESNERLEFLGDAVLQLAVTEDLYQRADRPDEGEMTRLRQELVSGEALLRESERLGLKEYLLYSGGEANIGEKTLSSLFETVTAAVYLDGGYAAAKRFVADNLVFRERKNRKGELQIFLQKRGKDLPKYEIVSKTGADNAPEFTCRATAEGKSAFGKGGRKSEAEAEAAEALFKLLESEETGERENAWKD